jgi:large conductance mechanosensitive channel
MGFVKEFKAFAMQGNVLDLAIGVIIGGAFGKIVTAMVENILMPLIGTIIGDDFSKMSTIINGAEVKYGLFLQAVVDFICIAFILFLIIKAANKAKKEAPPAPPAAPSSTDQLLMEIRDSLKK